MGNCFSIIFSFFFSVFSDNLKKKIFLSNGAHRDMSRCPGRQASTGLVPGTFREPSVKNVLTTNKCPHLLNFFVWKTLLHHSYSVQTPFINHSTNKRFWNVFGFKNTYYDSLMYLLLTLLLYLKNIKFSKVNNFSEERCYNVWRTKNLFLLTNQISLKW